MGDVGLRVGLGPLQDKQQREVSETREHRTGRSKRQPVVSSSNSSQRLFSEIDPISLHGCLVDGATIARKEVALKNYFADFCKSLANKGLRLKYFSVDTL